MECDETQVIMGGKASSDIQRDWMMTGTAVRGAGAARLDESAPMRGTFSDWLDTAHSLSAAAAAQTPDHPPVKQLQTNRDFAAGERR